MERSKLEKILMYVGLSSFVLAFIFFNVAPLLGSNGFDYVGIIAFGKGFGALFSFKFSDGPTVLFGGLFFIALVCLVIWFIQLATKEGKKEDFIRLAIAALGVFIAFGIYGGMFVAKVDFNGKEQILYDGIRRAVGSGFAKVLAMMSVGLSYLSIMVFTLLAFMGFEHYIFQDEI